MLCNHFFFTGQKKIISGGEKGKGVGGKKIKFYPLNEINSGNAVVTNDNIKKVELA